MHFAFQGLWRQSVVALMIAAVLDALDGLLARSLNSTSQIGAELDSFSDLVSFGVCPGVVVYCKVLYQWENLGWALVLMYAGCMALRLARFNVSTQEGSAPTKFFKGMPAPMGGYLLMWPIVIELASGSTLMQQPGIYAGLIFGSSLMLISSVPTFSLKGLTIPQPLVKKTLLGVFCFAALLYVTPWYILSILGGLYILTLPLSAYRFRKRPAIKQDEA